MGGDEHQRASGHDRRGRRERDGRPPRRPAAGPAGAAVRLHGEIAALAASGRAILPGETGETGDVGPPEFVMVLEGAANHAGPRIAKDAPETRCGWCTHRDTGTTRSWP